MSHITLCYGDKSDSFNLHSRLFSTTKFIALVSRHHPPWVFPLTGPPLSRPQTRYCIHCSSSVRLCTNSCPRVVPNSSSRTAVIVLVFMTGDVPQHDPVIDPHLLSSSDHSFVSAIISAEYHSWMATWRAQHWYFTAEIIDIVLCWEEKKRMSRVGDASSAVRQRATSPLPLHHGD